MNYVFICSLYKTINHSDTFTRLASYELFLLAKLLMGREPKSAGIGNIAFVLRMSVQNAKLSNSNHSESLLKDLVALTHPVYHPNATAAQQRF